MMALGHVAAQRPARQSLADLAGRAGLGLWMLRLSNGRAGFAVTPTHTTTMCL